MNKIKHDFTRNEINERLLALACFFKMIRKIKGVNAKKEASKYMLMHQVNDTLYFKNINTRRHIGIDMDAIKELVKAINENPNNLNK